MSEILDVMGTVLQSAGVGTLGSTIFLSRSPSSPDACVTLYETGAGYPIYTQGSTTGPRLTVANIQTVARAGREDYQTARTKITAIASAFEAVADSTVLSVNLLRIEQVGTPTPLGLDDNDRPRIAMTFSVTYGV